MDKSQQDKMNFIKHVILNSPPGKINDLVADIKILIGSSPIIISMIEDAIMEYDEKNYSLVPITDNDNTDYIIICPRGKHDNFYLQPKLKQLIQINHIKKKIVETKIVENLDYSSKLEDYRKACEQKLEEYIEIHFSKWNDIQIANYPSVNIKSKNGFNTKCSSAVYAKEEEEKYNLFLIICCDRSYLKNFHCSSWRSSWDVDFSLSDKEISLKGTINICINYFEDANTNFKTTKNFEKKIPMCSDVDKFSSSILSAISEYENHTLYDLNNFLINISISLVKNTRKILPLNGEKFDWKNVYDDISVQISYPLKIVNKKNIFFRTLLYNIKNSNQYKKCVAVFLLTEIINIYMVEVFFFYLKKKKNIYIYIFEHFRKRYFSFCCFLFKSFLSYTLI